jgi:hypothetical protein
MATLARTLGHVNAHLTELLPARQIIDAASASHHRWRQRKLGPVQTVLLLIVQILAGNASLAQLRAINEYQTSVSALAMARSRLPITLLEHVLAWLLSRFMPADRPRVLRIDCSNTYTQDTPSLRKAYRYPRQKRRRGHRPPCDYPQLRSICVFDVVTGLLLGEHDFASNHQESPRLKELLPLLRPGDIVIFDRGFVSYANLCLLQHHGVQGIARLAKTLRARSGTRRTREKRLGKQDQQVCWRKPTQRTSGVTPQQWDQLPQSLGLRQITLCCAAKHSRSRRITLITTLLDHTAYPPRIIGDYYRRRWEIETDFRHLKQTLGLEMLRTKDPLNVKRELLLRSIAYNLVRIVMLQAATEKRTTCDRISFADACRWLFLPCQNVPLTKLLSNPKRTRRSRPRKVKYRGKNYRQLNHRPSQARELN